MIKQLLFCLLLLISVSEIHAQNSSLKCDDKVFLDVLLENLVGKWNAGGSIGAEPVSYFLTGNWVLDHQFFQLHFKDISKEPEYIADVFIGYDCVSEHYIAHWLDNYGARPSEVLGYGTSSGDSIEFRFEYHDGPFTNKFIYERATDTWKFHSKSKNKKGEWVDFGLLNLKREN